MAELRDILADLVAFKTVTGDYEQTVELLSYVRTKLNGYLHEEDFIHNGFPSLVLSTQKTLKPKLTLAAHIDVVPAEDDLFHLVRDDDKLYGRGVYDMKFALACYIKLCQELQEQLRQYDFAIMLTSDEEYGGRNGVGALLERGYQTDVCFLPDGGDNWQIESLAKGAWHIKLSVGGTAAHGSRPWEGDNAAAKMMHALQEIQSIDTGNPTGTTVVTTQIQAGHAVNQIPDCAWATVDIRFMTMDDYDLIHNQVLRIAKRYGCSVEVQQFIEPIKHKLSDRLVQQYIAIAKRAIGEPVSPTMSFGASDARFFVAKHIPTIVIRPKGGGQHGTDEWISEQSLEQFYQTLKQYVQTVASA